MLNRKNLIAFSLLSCAVAAVPLAGTQAFVPGATILPYMEAQQDVAPSASSADVSTGYADMTKKDCKALKKHKNDYSADEYKGRSDYCKKLLKSKKGKKKAKAANQPTDSGSAASPQ